MSKEEMETALLTYFHPAPQHGRAPSLRQQGKSHLVVYVLGTCCVGWWRVSGQSDPWTAKFHLLSLPHSRTSPWQAARHSPPGEIFIGLFSQALIMACRRSCSQLVNIKGNLGSKSLYFFQATHCIPHIYTHTYLPVTLHWLHHLRHPWNLPYHVHLHKNPLPARGCPLYCCLFQQQQRLSRDSSTWVEEFA